MKTPMGIHSTRDRKKTQSPDDLGLQPNDDCPTPVWLIDRMVTLADRIICDNGIVPYLFIDPCSGDGRIGRGVKDLSKYPKIFEFDIKHGTDFFSQPIPETDNEKYDFSIFNPPFSKVGSYRFSRHLLDHFIYKEGFIIAIWPIYSVIMSEQSMAGRAC